jgi:fimbrial chaperone protein
MASVRQRAMAAVGTSALAGLMALAGTPACMGQGEGSGANQEEVIKGLGVVPVSFELHPGQMTAVLTIQNDTDREADFQVRPYAWAQPGGTDQLSATDVLVASPPLGRVSVGAGQVVRLVLLQPAQAREASYRVLLDQVPPPPQPGVVGFALRLSIPVFAEPSGHVAPHVRWSVQSDGGAYNLVAVNDGGRHDTFRDMALTAADGRQLALEQNISPYVLAGATRRWRILASPGPPREGLRLRARADSGAIDQTVSAPSAGP